MTRRHRQRPAVAAVVAFLLFLAVAQLEDRSLSGREAFLAITVGAGVFIGLRAFGTRNGSR